MNKVFDKIWFTKHQRKLLWLANSWLGNYVFQFKKMGHQFEHPIIKITPQSVAEILDIKPLDNGNYKLTIKEYFFSRNEYARKLYLYLYPMWLLMHIWDLLADLLIPKLSFGFSTLTVNPVAGSNSPVDGYSEYFGDPSWSTTRDAADGLGQDDTVATGVMGQGSKSGANYVIRRAGFCFDTSSLTSSASISAAVISFAGMGTASGDADSSTVDIVGLTLAATSTVGTADYDQFGTTVYANMNVSAWATTDGTYNDFTLDANGRNNISKTSVSQFGMRIGRDTANSAPTGLNRVFGRYADAGTNKPKLVITYTLSAGTAILLSSMGVG